MSPSRKARYSYTATHTHTHKMSKCPVPFWENLISDACSKIALLTKSAPLLLLPKEQNTVIRARGMTAMCQAVSYLIPHGNTYYHLCFAYEETKAQSHFDTWASGAMGSWLPGWTWRTQWVGNEAYGSPLPSASLMPLRSV